MFNSVSYAVLLLERCLRMCFYAFPPLTSFRINGVMSKHSSVAWLNGVHSIFRGIRPVCLHTKQQQVSPLTLNIGVANVMSFEHLVWAFGSACCLFEINVLLEFKCFIEMWCPADFSHRLNHFRWCAVNTLDFDTTNTVYCNHSPMSMWISSEHHTPASYKSERKIETELITALLDDWCYSLDKPNARHSIRKRKSVTTFQRWHSTKWIVFATSQSHSDSI